MVSFHALFPSLKGNTCLKIYSISELYLCFGFIVLGMGIKSGEHKNAITTQKFKNIEDPLPGFMIRNKYKRSLVKGFKNYELSTD